MSSANAYKKTATYPCAPATARGESTKLSSAGDKIVYVNGKTVIIRDLQSPHVCVAYSGHVQPTTAARLSPSGFYCASADAGGTVRVWDVVGADQTLKGEYKVLSGKLRDLAWDGESKRIIAVGDGREKFGHAFMMDSGSSTGEIGGHAKAVNAVAIRAQRPYRAATAGDDALVVFHSGAPYKYTKTITTHTKFVQDVQYAPDGAAFVSVGSDYKIFLYDGTSGDVLGEVTDAPHKGTIYAAAWNAQSTHVATASADGTVKVWDAKTRASTAVFTAGSGVNNQQVGVTCTPRGIVSASMDGALNVWDERAPGDRPAQVLVGPQKGITAGTTLADGTFLAGSYDGRVCRFAAEDGKAAIVPGSGHTGQVVGVSALGVGGDGGGKGEAVSVGFDDCAREIRGVEGFSSTTVSLGGQPRALAVLPGADVSFVASNNGLAVVKDGQKILSVKTDFGAASVAAARGGVVAVGGEDNKIRLYDWAEGALKLRPATLDANRGAVSALAFTPDGSLLAAGDSSGKIVVYDVAGGKPTITRWTFHSARVAALAFREDGKALVSGSLDTHVYVWSVTQPGKYVAIRNAIPGGCAAAAWRAADEVVAAGADACVRAWRVEVPV